MIEQYQILQAIQSMAHSRFPQIPILEDLTTADFPRPSFYLDPEPLTLEDAGRRLIRVQWAIGLIYFPPVDEESQDAVMEQLLTGSQAKSHIRSLIRFWEWRERQCRLTTGKNGY